MSNSFTLLGFVVALGQSEVIVVAPLYPGQLSAEVPTQWFYTQYLHSINHPRCSAVLSYWLWLCGNQFLFTDFFSYNGQPQTMGFQQKKKSILFYIP